MDTDFFKIIREIPMFRVIRVPNLLALNHRPRGEGSAIQDADGLPVHLDQPRLRQLANDTAQHVWDSAEASREFGLVRPAAALDGVPLGGIQKQFGGSRRGR